MNELSKLNPRFNQQVDHIFLGRKLALIAGLIFTVVIACYTVKSGNQLFMFGFVALPFILMLMNRPGLTLVLSLILDATNIPIPLINSGTLGVLGKTLLIAVAFLGVLLGQRPWKGDKLVEQRFLKLFAAIILILMVFRGSGLRFLGSSTWGGTMYIFLLVGIAFYFAVNGLSLSNRQIKQVVWGSLVAGIIGALVRRMGWTQAAELSEVGASRLMWLTPLAMSILPFAFVLKPKKVHLLNLLILFICLLLIGLTGFRSRLVAMLMISFGCGYFLVRNKTRFILLMVVVGLFCWGGLVLISPKLPMGLQRSISFVPGVQIQSQVADNALNSIEWRVEIWKYCLEQAPQYLFLGRGSAFDVHEAVENLTSHDIATFSPWFAFTTRSYHSGPLTLLIDYGLPGFVVVLCLGIIIFHRLWKMAKEVSIIDSFVARYAAFLCASVLWYWFAFFFVYGDIRGLSSMITQTIVAFVIGESVLRINELQSEVDDQIANNGEQDYMLD
jgi:hypothetical protein